MTKAEELTVLDKAIAELGPDSYLGPWLRQVRNSVEQDIRSDFYPTVTLAECRSQCDRIMDDAKMKAYELVSKAEAQDSRMRERTRQYVNSAASALRQAMRQIENE